MKEVKQSFHREDSDDGNFFDFLTQFTSECGYFAAIKETHVISELMRCWYLFWRQNNYPTQHKKCEINSKKKARLQHKLVNTAVALIFKHQKCHIQIC